MAKDVELDEIDDAAPDAPKQLRDYAARQKARADKAEKLEKELAATKAGIDTDSRLGKAWMESTEADFSDLEALKADALEFSPTLVKGAEQQATASTQGEQQVQNKAPVQVDTGTEQRQALSDGQTGEGLVKDVHQEARDQYQADLASGKSRGEALGGVVHSLARAEAERQDALNPQ